MKKAFSMAVIAAIAAPLAAQAAWWNPFSWFHREPSQPKQEIAATTTADASVGATSTLPTVDELNRRIAELEDKLDKARQDAKAAETAAAAPKAVPAASAPAAGSSSGLTQKQVIAKVSPAIVLVETSQGFAGGVMIDPQGYVLTSAHAVWIQTNGNVTGASTQATVTLSSGAKRSAKLVGLDEANDLAVVKLNDGAPFSYVPATYGASTNRGDTVYVFGFPSGRSGSSGGSSVVSAAVVSKTSNVIEATTDTKPLDTGGAMVTAKGEFIGVPNHSTCKIVEEGTNCLKYDIKTNILRSVVGKVIAGMRLYRDKQDETKAESLVAGEFKNMYGNASNAGVIDVAVTSVTGQNSFELLDNRLLSDTDGKIAKIYILKLKQAAQNMYAAADFLKGQSYALHVFLIDESASVDTLDPYQKKIVAAIQAQNDKKTAEYQAKVALWSNKKNEYDSYETDPSKASKDYLMAEGAFLESAAKYFAGEKQWMMDTFSGENVDIF